MSRLSELRVVDPVLTTLARGYVNAEFIASVLFPFAPVEKEAGKIPQFGKEAFKLYNTLRAIRAKSNRLSPEGISTIPYVCEEHDLEYPIDYREEEEAMFPLEQHAARTVTDALLLRYEKECADLAQDLNTYPTGNKVTLSGTSQWTDKDNSNPIADVRAGKGAVRAAIGKYPNKMTLGATSFEALQDHPVILERIKYSERGIVTVDLLKVIFDIPDIRVGKAIYADDDDAFHDVWADNCIMAYVPERKPDERSPYEPSYGYTLRKRGYPQIDKRDKDGKIRLVRNTDIVVSKVLGAEAGYIINDTNG